MPYGRSEKLGELGTEFLSLFPFEEHGMRRDDLEFHRRPDGEDARRGFAAMYDAAGGETDGV